MRQYDYLIIGAGLTGAVIAHEARRRGRSVLVVERRGHIAGHCYTESMNAIMVHRYGAHIFHTDDEEVWRYINKFGTMNAFIYSPMAVYNGMAYSMPFNLNTFSQIYREYDRSKIKEYIDIDSAMYRGVEALSLEQRAIQLVGNRVYQMLIKGYTEKQWGRKCSEIPAYIIDRLPVRLEYNSNYFNDKYQGMPEKGYTALIEKMLSGVEVMLNTDYKSIMSEVSGKNIVYSGAIDEYYNYCFGRLEYRSLRFEDEWFDTEYKQGCAVLNYTSSEVPYTRTIEHKYFLRDKADCTLVTKEYPVEHVDNTTEPYYPIGLQKNRELYDMYLQKSKQEGGIDFVGRLGLYKYMDMDDCIRLALDYVKRKMDEQA